MATYEERVAARKALLKQHGVEVNIRGPRAPRTQEQVLVDQINGYKGLLADINREFAPDAVEHFVGILTSLEARLAELRKPSPAPSAQ